MRIGQDFGLTEEDAPVVRLSDEPSNPLRLRKAGSIDVLTVNILGKWVHLDHVQGSDLNVLKAIIGGGEGFEFKEENLKLIRSAEVMADVCIRKVDGIQVVIVRYNGNYFVSPASMLGAIRTKINMDLT